MPSYLVDTCVISELVKKKPQEAVVDWLGNHETELYLSAITLEEMRFGALMLPEGKRRTALMESIDDLMAEFVARVWGIDALTADLCAQLHATAVSAGYTPTIEDLMIAATCIQQGATLVTCNVRDFDYLGIPFVNPFEGA